MSEWICELDEGQHGKEEIIRCRDCIYSVNDAMYCTEGCCDESEYRNVEPDGFCKWGRRRK